MYHEKCIFDVQVLLAMGYRMGIISVWVWRTSIYFWWSYAQNDCTFRPYDLKLAL